MLKPTLKLMLRCFARPMLGPPVPLAVQRVWIVLLTRIMLNARGITSSAETVGSVRCETLRPPSGGHERAILFLHGGAYVIGSPLTHRALTTHLAQFADATVLVPDYRLAPEHPYPAALDDALAAYEQLLQRFPASRIAISGDSAGGGLAMSLAIAIRDRGLPQPAALALIAPWVDLSASGESLRTRVKRDPMIRPGWSKLSAAMYRGALAADDPRVSPLFAELSGLPPTLIQIGTEEVLYSDAERLAESLRAAGTPVTFEPWEGMWHDFHLHVRALREADQAIAGMTQFMREAWSRHAHA